MMKNIICAACLLVNNINWLCGQDFNLLKNKIDSVIKVEGSINLGGGNYSSFSKNYKLTSEEEKKTIDFLNSYFNEDSLFNLHHVVYDLIFSIGFNSKSLENRQNVVQILLDNINFFYVDKNLPWRFKKEDFTDNARKRLKEIIFKGKTDRELIMNMRYYRMHHSYSTLNIENSAKHIAKFDTSVNLKHIEDSLFNSYVESDLAYYRKNCCYSKIIKSIGWLEMKECIPTLELLLSNNSYFGDFEFYRSIRYTLARLGEKKYEDELIKNDSLLDYRYLNDEKALFKYFDLYYNPKKFVCPLSPCRSNEEYASMGYLTIIEVQDYVINFPLDLKLNPFKSSNFDEDKAAKGYKWLYANRGRLVLDENSW